MFRLLKDLFTIKAKLKEDDRGFLYITSSCEGLKVKRYFQKPLGERLGGVDNLEYYIIKKLEVQGYVMIKEMVDGHLLRKKNKYGIVVRSLDHVTLTSYKGEFKGSSQIKCLIFIEKLQRKLLKSNGEI